MKTDLFQSCSHCWVPQICWHFECSHLTASSFRIWNSSTGIPSFPLALFVVMLPKAHLTSHSRMSGSRWVITPLWLTGSWRSVCTVLLCKLYYIKKQRYYFADKGPSNQSYSFSSVHVWMWELDHKEGWVLKNWCFWTMVLEKTLESPLDCKEIQPVHPKGNQSWIFIGRTDAEAEAPVLWPSDVKSWLIKKRPWCWERLKAGAEGDDRGQDC